MSWARDRVATTVFCVVRSVRVLRRRAVLKSVHNHLYRLNVSVRNIFFSIYQFCGVGISDKSAVLAVDAE